jgi:predicted acylesterase/phospholipase RssA
VSRPRLGVVLSAGGLRGAAHLGVLRRLIAAKIPIDVIVGVSAGAIVGAYYAAVGMSIDEIIADAPRMRLRHILLHGSSFRVPQRLDTLDAITHRHSPARLAALERAGFRHVAPWHQRLRRRLSRHADAHAVVLSRPPNLTASRWRRR